MKRFNVTNSANSSTGKRSISRYIISNLNPFQTFIINFGMDLNRIKRLTLNLIVIVFLIPFYNSYSKNNNGNEPKKPLIYNIIRNDEVIGKIEINLSTNGDSIVYDIESDVLAKFILKFKVLGKEKYIYKNGTLVYSSQFRTLNNKVKTNHSILYDKGEYSLKTPEKISPLDFEAIKCNLVKLYINEPVGVNWVFCDNQQQMVKVEPLGNGVYKVEFSRGKYNIFYYENGRCVKIKAVSPLFDVTLIPLMS